MRSKLKQYTQQVQGFLIHLFGGMTKEEVKRITDHMKWKISQLEKGVDAAYQRGVNKMVIDFDYKLKHMTAKGIKNQYHEIVQWVNRLYLSL